MGPLPDWEVELCAEIDDRFPPGEWVGSEVVTGGTGGDGGQSKSRAAQHVKVVGLAGASAGAHISAAGGLLHLAAAYGTRPTDGVDGAHMQLVGLPESPKNEIAEEEPEEVELVPGGVRAETYRALQNLEIMLRACGCALKDIAKLTVCISETGKAVADLGLKSKGSLDSSMFKPVWEAVDEACTRFFELRRVPQCVRTHVGCAAFPLKGAAVQVEGLAVAQPRLGSIQAVAAAAGDHPSISRKELMQRRAAAGATSWPAMVGRSLLMPLPKLAERPEEEPPQKKEAKKKTPAFSPPPGIAKPFTSDINSSASSPILQECPQTAPLPSAYPDLQDEFEMGPDEEGESVFPSLKLKKDQGPKAKAKGKQKSAGSPEPSVIAPVTSLRPKAKGQAKGLKDDKEATPPPELVESLLAAVSKAASFTEEVPKSQNQSEEKTPKADEEAKPHAPDEKPLQQEGEKPAEKPFKLSPDASVFVPSPLLSTAFPAAPPLEEESVEPEAVSACLRHHSSVKGTFVRPSEIPNLSQHTFNSAASASVALKLRFDGERDATRTVRCLPPHILMHREFDEGWAATMPGFEQHQMWVYNFDISVLTTRYSYLNFGLLEWKIPRKAEAKTLTELMNAATSDTLSMNNLFGGFSSTEIEESWKLEENCSEEQTGEMMMLGCKKGVRWFGKNLPNAPLFRDDIMPQSVLHFRVEYRPTKNAGVMLRVTLQPSPIVFKQRGAQMVTMKKPVFETQLPSQTSDVGTLSSYMWVPAITFHTRGDEVAFSWSATVG